MQFSSLTIAALCGALVSGAALPVEQVLDIEKLYVRETRGSLINVSFKIKGTKAECSNSNDGTKTKLLKFPSVPCAGDSSYTFGIEKVLTNPGHFTLYVSHGDLEGHGDIELLSHAGGDGPMDHFYDQQWPQSVTLKKDT